ncbi:MAG: dephospho-CoA kinase, partial [Ghiorsea sp.]
MSLFYGLTGGIGSGKSTATDFFATLGVPTLDLDQVGKTLLQQDVRLVEQLVSSFDESILDENKQLKRETLASIAFGSPENTEKLNAIMHPHIVAYETRWRVKQTAPFCIIEASVLIESAGVSRMDGLIVLLADKALRQQRVLQRNKQSLATFEKIVAQQCSDEERVQLADYRFDNNDTLPCLEREVVLLFNKLCENSLNHPASQHCEEINMSKVCRVLMSAGEVSGDLHASAVIQALKTQVEVDCTLEIAGIAGSMMQAQGCQVVRSLHDLNVMGIGDVIMALPRIKRVERDFLAFANAFKPDVVVLTDFTSFHIGLGRKLRARGFFVIHYIAPKLWAWGAGRLPKLQKSQNKLACIFPFEQAWFQARGIDATYVGNPSAFACQGGWSKRTLKSKLGLADDVPLLALLPGSRAGELKRHVQLLADVFGLLQQQITNLAAVVTLAPGVDKSALQPLLDVGVHLLERTEQGYALRADAAVAVSGTATLELALWQTP